MKKLLSNFMNVTVLLLAALLLFLPIPEIVVLGVAFIGMVLSFVIFVVANEKNITLFRKLCSYFGLLSVCLLVILLRNDLTQLGRNYTFTVTAKLGKVLYYDNYIVEYALICLILFSLLYISKNESLTIDKIAVTEEHEKGKKLLAECSKILSQTARFTVLIHFCFFVVGVAVALFIGQYALSDAFIEIGKRLGSISIMAIIPQLIAWGALKKVQIAAFN